MRFLIIYRKYENLLRLIFFRKRIKRSPCTFTRNEYGNGEYDKYRGKGDHYDKGRQRDDSVSSDDDRYAKV